MRYNILTIFFLLILLFTIIPTIKTGKKPMPIEANPDAKRLYDDLLSNYNRLIRPVANNTDKLMVWMGMRLAQIIEVNLRSQIITASLWLIQRWFDYKLRWDPKEYGGLDTIYVPSDLIWLPDIVLFNNADGNFEVTLMTKAILKHTGEVKWTPPAIYKFYCEMNVLYFPFDEQNCLLKFGSWTYNGYQVDLRHIDQGLNKDIVPIGIDLTEFILSVEWDLLEVPAKHNEEYYPGCDEPYSDITFYIMMRRKTLFYTVNLIIPLVGITFLTVLVFYLPSDSCEKVTLCSSILVSLTVFFLLLAEIIPPTSLAVPLLGKYLLFTMALVSLSICTTVCVLNVYYRSPTTHKMSEWVRWFFLEVLPSVLLMSRPPYSTEVLYSQSHMLSPDSPTAHICTDFHRDSISDSYDTEDKSSPQELMTAYKSTCSAHTHHDPHIHGGGHSSNSTFNPDNVVPRRITPQAANALQGVRFIAQQIKNVDQEREVSEDWKYISMVLDRLFLFIFTFVCVVGTCIIIFQAPSLYDNRPAIDNYFAKKHSEMKNITLPGPPDFEDYPVDDNSM